MYHSQKVRCADCGDVFRIEYDSRKEMENVYTCKCGKLRCYPYLTSFSHNRNGNVEEMDYDEEQHIYENYEEDYIKLSDNANLLLSEINELGDRLSKEKGIYYYDFSDDDYLSLSISERNEIGESIEIKVKVSLCDNEGWKYGREQQNSRVIEALTRFKNILNQLIRGEINLCNPQNVWDNESLEWNDGLKEQKRLYDYTLYC